MMNDDAYTNLFPAEFNSNSFNDLPSGVLDPLMTATAMTRTSSANSSPLHGSLQSRGSPVSQHSHHHRRGGGGGGGGPPRRSPPPPLLSPDAGIARSTIMMRPADFSATELYTDGVGIAVGDAQFVIDIPSSTSTVAPPPFVSVTAANSRQGSANSSSTHARSSTFRQEQRQSSASDRFSLPPKALTNGENSETVASTIDTGVEEHEADYDAPDAGGTTSDDGNNAQAATLNQSLSGPIPPEHLRLLLLDQADREALYYREDHASRRRLAVFHRAVLSHNHAMRATLQSMYQLVASAQQKSTTTTTTDATIPPPPPQLTIKAASLPSQFMDPVTSRIMSDPVVFMNKRVLDRPSADALVFRLFSTMIRCNAVGASKRQEFFTYCLDRVLVSSVAREWSQHVFGEDGLSMTPRGDMARSLRHWVKSTLGSHTSVRQAVIGSIQQDLGIPVPVLAVDTADPRHVGDARGNARTSGLPHHRSAVMDPEDVLMLATLGDDAARTALRPWDTLEHMWRDACLQAIKGRKSLKSVRATNVASARRRLSSSGMTPWGGGVGGRPGSPMRGRGGGSRGPPPPVPNHNKQDVMSDSTLQHAASPSNHYTAAADASSSQRRSSSGPERRASNLADGQPQRSSFGPPPSESHTHTQTTTTCWDDGVGSNFVIEIGIGIMGSQSFDVVQSRIATIVSDETAARLVLEQEMAVTLLTIEGEMVEEMRVVAAYAAAALHQQQHQYRRRISVLSGGSSNGRGGGNTTARASPEDLLGGLIPSRYPVGESSQHNRHTHREDDDGGINSHNKGRYHAVRHKVAQAAGANHKAPHRVQVRDVSSALVVAKPASARPPPLLRTSSVSTQSSSATTPTRMMTASSMDPFIPQVYQHNTTSTPTQQDGVMHPEDDTSHPTHMETSNEASQVQLNASALSKTSTDLATAAPSDEGPPSGSLSHEVDLHNALDSTGDMSKALCLYSAEKRSHVVVPDGLDGRPALTLEQQALVSATMHFYQDKQLFEAVFQFSEPWFDELEHRCMVWAEEQFTSMADSQAAQRMRSTKGREIKRPVLQPTTCSMMGGDGNGRVRNPTSQLLTTAGAAGKPPSSRRNPATTAPSSPIAKPTLSSDATTHRKAQVNEAQSSKSIAYDAVVVAVDAPPTVAMDPPPTTFRRHKHSGGGQSDNAATTVQHEVKPNDAWRKRITSAPNTSSHHKVSNGVDATTPLLFPSALLSMPESFLKPLPPSTLMFKPPGHAAAERERNRPSLLSRYVDDFVPPSENQEFPQTMLLRQMELLYTTFDEKGMNEELLRKRQLGPYYFEPIVYPDEEQRRLAEREKSVLHAMARITIDTLNEQWKPPASPRQHDKYGNERSGGGEPDRLAVAAYATQHPQYVPIRPSTSTVGARVWAGKTNYTLNKLPINAARAAIPSTQPLAVPYSSRITSAQTVKAAVSKFQETFDRRAPTLPSLNSQKQFLQSPRSAR